MALGRFSGPRKSSPYDLGPCKSSPSRWGRPVKIRDSAFSFNGKQAWKALRQVVNEASLAVPPSALRGVELCSLGRIEWCKRLSSSNQVRQVAAKFSCFTEKPSIHAGSVAMRPSWAIMGVCCCAASVILSSLASCLWPSRLSRMRACGRRFVPATAGNRHLQGRRAGPGSRLAGSRRPPGFAGGGRRRVRRSRWR